MKYLRILACVGVAALVLLTIVPADDRPVTGLQHDVEHFGAFLLPGLLLGFAFEKKTSLLLIGAVWFCLALEAIQIPLSTRHARLEDALVDSLAMCIGIVAGRLAKSQLLRLRA
ncbi:VanZ family protein [Rhodopseudomonas rhenobacensis]|uniref:VanZ family protein n=1 Tax=Rhodopseudomonas rhenobacensis TaxID=87461 RepID=A0A7W7Z7C4_9BRAD|nr:VanZ family protein [Rhodopseudomonas rhenobacensis]MBB5049376.1 VanZ family protein [Rhodopseudomonas rhenobacensis]